MDLHIACCVHGRSTLPPPHLVLFSTVGKQYCNWEKPIHTTEFKTLDRVIFDLLQVVWNWPSPVLPDTLDAFNTYLVVPSLVYVKHSCLPAQLDRGAAGRRQDAARGVTHHDGESGTAVTHVLLIIQRLVVCCRCGSRTEGQSGGKSTRRKWRRLNANRRRPKRAKRRARWGTTPPRDWGKNLQRTAPTRPSSMRRGRPASGRRSRASRAPRVMLKRFTTTEPNPVWSHRGGTLSPIIYRDEPHSDTLPVDLSF